MGEEECVADQAQIIQTESGSTYREMIAKCPNRMGDRKSEDEREGYNGLLIG